MAGGRLAKPSCALILRRARLGIADNARVTCTALPRLKMSSERETVPNPKTLLPPPPPLSSPSLPLPLSVLYVNVCAARVGCSSPPWERYCPSSSPPISSMKYSQGGSSDDARSLHFSFLIKSGSRAHPSLSTLTREYDGAIILLSSAASPLYRPWRLEGGQR